MPSTSHDASDEAQPHNLRVVAIRAGELLCRLARNVAKVRSIAVSQGIRFDAVGRHFGGCRRRNIAKTSRAVLPTGPVLNAATYTMGRPSKLRTIAAGERLMANEATSSIASPN